MGNRLVKKQLMIRCGKIDMYDMKRYRSEKLTLHHYPPFRQTQHTVFEESYLLTRDNHGKIEKMERDDPEQYAKVMQIIEENKKILMKKRGYL